MAQRNENMIAALRRERAVYAARGDHDRVAQVDAQLKHYGDTLVQDQVADEAGGPKGRAGRGGRQRTTAAGK